LRTDGGRSTVSGVFGPVEIDGRGFVDGGVWSPTNLASLQHGEAQVAIVSPDEATVEATGARLMDQSRRGDVIAAGVAQGRSLAGGVAG
jgi:NTE family protein